MKASLTFTLGVAVGLIVASTALLISRARERSRVEAEIAGLKQELKRADQAAQSDREALRRARQDHEALVAREPVPPKQSGSIASTAVVADAPINSAILGYLGEPVAPPSTLDPKYSADGLVAAFNALCAARGVNVEKLGVDTSEFPFIIHGVLGNGSEFFKRLDVELRGLPGYTYGGSSTGRPRNGSMYFSLNMTPSSAFPRDQTEAIHRRLMIRLQMISAAWADTTR